MRKRKHNRTAGFSLIEVMVGIALLGLVTVPVCASLVLSVRLNSHAQSMMEAQLQAAGVVETLLAEGVDPSKVTSDDKYPTDMEGVTVFVDYVDETNYYKVKVSAEVNGEEVSFETAAQIAPPPPSDPTPDPEEGGETE